MKRTPFVRNPYRRLLLGIIRGSEVPLEKIDNAFASLGEEDRDCLRWVPRALAVER